VISPKLENVEKCFLCGSEGEVLYKNLKDAVFGTSGEWQLFKCQNPECHLVWLNPRPVQEDISFAYSNYYTHTDSQAGSGTLRNFYRKIQKSYLLSALGYDFGENSYWGKLIFLDPEMLEDTRGKVMYLKNTGGNILDVGCGSGQFLDLMKSLGWNTTGVDFDEKAVLASRQKDLDVHLGSLEEQHFPDNYFDAITLSQVIEHVYDPTALLMECRRILKPGGRIVICTPNFNSIGSRLFKNHWRGLEPPRHLNIFTPGSLKRLVELSGLEIIRNHSTVRGASFMYRTSSEIKNGQYLNKRYFIREKIFAYSEFFLIKIGDFGEEILSVVTKKERQL
jgi:2-polyprenyl-3-methyl-5-hydroxy-6-metoxy-1,4-benzoquinol methylase